MTAHAKPLRRDDPGRSRNLSRILSRIHVTPTSRSDLTRLTGLNRSTVGTLVTELTERGLAVEDDSRAAGQVGRPSLIARPSDRTVALAANPEIDAITIGAVLLGGRVLTRRRIELARIPDVDRAVTLIGSAVGELRASLEPAHEVVGLGLAIPGIVRTSDAHVRFAPHLGWRDAPLGSLLAHATGLPVHAANDAALGARAEWTFGAGRDTDNLVYVNGGSSGIGGGIISGGAPLGGRNGHAGEIGHLSVRPAGSIDSAGLTGTLESEVRRSDLLRVLGVTTANPDELEKALLAAVSAEASPANEVRAEVERQIDALAIALGSAVNLLDPERIVLGGFLGSLAAVDLPRIRAGVARHSLPAVDPVAIARSQLGSDLLLIGAAELPFAALFDSL